jgi:DNA-binding CsgD family transcriptional regulator
MTGPHHRVAKQLAAGLDRQALVSALNLLGELAAQADLARLLRHATQRRSGLAASKHDLDRFIHARPLMPFRSHQTHGGARRIPDPHTPARFRSGGLHSEHRPLGFAHAMAAPLIAGRRVVRFVPNRRWVDFSERERRLMSLVRPALADLHASRVALEEARERAERLCSLVLGDSAALLVLDSDRCLRDNSPNAAAMLARHQPGATLLRGSRLPARLDAWLCDVLTNKPLASATETPHGLSLSLVRDSVRGESYLMLRERVSLLQQLTTREHEVLRWLAAGKTNAEIAQILGTSARTVQKHLEHIFVKLGVETRTAAIARALGLGAALQARA